MADFFHMSGYAFYVWTSYVVGAGLLLLNVWLARGKFVRARAEAKRRLGMQKGSQ
jgi:heme exporter protein CcmD